MSYDLNCLLLSTFKFSVIKSLKLDLSALKIYVYISCFFGPSLVNALKLDSEIIGHVYFLSRQVVRSVLCSAVT